LAAHVRRGEVELAAMVVAKGEQRRFDAQAPRELDKPSPVGTAPKLPVVHDFEADVLLELDDVADRLVLNGAKLRRAEPPVVEVAKRVAQPRRTKKAADVVGARRRTAVDRDVHRLRPRDERAADRLPPLANALA